MSSEQTLSFLISKFDERRVEIEQHLGRSAAKTYDEYQKLCGFLQGLEFAKEVILDLAKRMETADDE
jgi:hypothetical protein